MNLEAQWVAQVSRLWSQLHTAQIQRQKQVQSCLELCDPKSINHGPSTAEQHHPLKPEPGPWSGSGVMEAAGEVAGLQKAKRQLEADIQSLKESYERRCSQLEAAAQAAEQTAAKQASSFKDLQALLVEASKQRMRRSIHRLHELRSACAARWHVRLLTAWRSQSTGKLGNRGLRLGSLLGHLESGRGRIQLMVALWRRRAHVYASRQKARKGLAALRDREQQSHQQLQRVCIQLFNHTMRNVGYHQRLTAILGWQLNLAGWRERQARRSVKSSAAAHQADMHELKGLSHQQALSLARVISSRCSSLPVQALLQWQLRCQQHMAHERLRDRMHSHQVRNQKLSAEVRGLGAKLEASRHTESVLHEELESLRDAMVTQRCVQLENEVTVLQAELRTTSAERDQARSRSVAQREAIERLEAQLVASEEEAQKLRRDSIQQQADNRMCAQQISAAIHSSKESEASVEELKLKLRMRALQDLVRLSSHRTEKRAGHAVTRWIMHRERSEMSRQLEMERDEWTEKSLFAAQSILELKQQRDEAKSRAEAAERAVEGARAELLKEENLSSNAIWTAQMAVRKATLEADAAQIAAAQVLLDEACAAADREQQELAESKERTAAAEARAEELMSSVSMLERKIEGLEQNLLEASTTSKCIQARADASARCHQDLEGMVEALAPQAAKAEQLSRDLALQHERIECSLQREESLSNRLVEMEAKHSQMELELQQVQSERDLSNSEAKAAAVREERLASQIGAEHKKSHDLERRCSQLSTKNEESEAEIAREKQLRENMSEAVEAYKGRISTLESSLHSAQLEVLERADSEVRLKEQAQNLEAEAKESREQVRHLSSALEELNKERDTLQLAHSAQFAELVSFQAQRHGVDAGVKMRIDAATQPGLSLSNLELPAEAQSKLSTPPNPKAPVAWSACSVLGDAESVVQRMCEGLESVEEQLHGIRTLQLLGADAARQAGGSHAVLVAMERHPTAWVLQHSGCLALAEFAVTSPSGSPVGSISAEMICRAISHAMKAHREQALLQSQAVDSLLQLARAGCVLSFEVLTNVIELLKKASTEDETIQTSLTLLQHAGHTAAALSWNEVVRLVANVTTTRPHLLSLVCETLTCFIHEDAAAAASAVRAAPVAQCLHNAFSEIVLVNAESALAVASLSCSIALHAPPADSSEEEVCRSSLLVDILLRWPLDGKVTLEGVGALAKRVVHTPDRVLAEQDVDNVALALSSLLDSPAESLRHHALALSALEAVLSEALPVEPVTLSTAIGRVVRVMERRPEEHELQVQCCSLLASVLVVAGYVPGVEPAIVATIACMHRIPAVQAHGCALLASVAPLSPSPTTKAAAVRAVILSLKSGGLEVQQLAFHAMVSLTEQGSFQLRQLAADEGVVGLLATSLQANTLEQPEDMTEDRLRLLAILGSDPDQHRLQTAAKILAPRMVAIARDLTDHGAIEAVQDCLAILHGLVSLGGKVVKDMLAAGVLEVLEGIGRRRGQCSDEVKSIISLVERSQSASKQEMKLRRQLEAAPTRLVQGLESSILSAGPGSLSNVTRGATDSDADLFEQFLEEHHEIRESASLMFSNLPRRKAVAMLRQEFSDVFDEWLKTKKKQNSR